MVYEYYNCGGQNWKGSTNYYTVHSNRTYRSSVGAVGVHG